MPTAHPTTPSPPIAAWLAPGFTRNASYTVTGDYFDQEFIASDSQQGVVTGSNGAWLELGWTLTDGLKLSSITAVKDYYFNAFRDDERSSG